MKYALISTEKGDMKVELYAEETPITVDNFVKLATARFYVITQSYDYSLLCNKNLLNLINKSKFRLQKRHRR